MTLLRKVFTTSLANLTDPPFWAALTNAPENRVIGWFSFILPFKIKIQYYSKRAYDLKS